MDLEEAHMRSALYKPIAAGVAVLVGLLITPTIFPWIPWQIVLIVIGPVAYLAYDPAQTARGFIKAYTTIIGKVDWTLLLRFSCWLLLIVSFCTMAFLLTRPLEPTLVILSEVERFVVLLKISAVVTFLVAYEGWLVWYLANFGRVTENWRDRDKISYLIQLHTMALPVVGQALFLVDLTIRITKNFRQICKTILGFIWYKTTLKVCLFVYTFVKIIHSRPRVVCMIDGLIGFMVSYRLFVQTLDLEAAQYLVAGALVGYCLGLIHNLAIQAVRYLAKELLPSGQTINLEG